MQQNDHDSIDSDETVHCFTCEVSQIKISSLQKKLAALGSDNHALRKELCYLRDTIASMRSALENSRSVIQTLQVSHLAEKRPNWKHGAVLVQKLQVARTFKFHLSAKSQTPKYISQADLEYLVCRTAQKVVHGIGGVILEFYQYAGDHEGSNWRISGIISGKVDQETASKAVQQAALKYADWVMVDDENMLRGKAVKLGRQRQLRASD